MGLCTEQLAKSLLALFRDVNPDTSIDEAVARAMKQKQAEDEAKSQSFDAQVKTLLDKGYAEATGMEKDRFLGYLNPLKEHFRPDSVIVIPENMVPLAKMMTMVKLNGETGYTLLDISQIYDTEETKAPRKPYLIHGVEDGKAMLGTSPDNCVKRFKQQGRFGLNAQEGIAVVTHKPEILKDHYMDLSGSRYESSDFVPYLYLIEGRPRLNWGYAYYSSSEWGSASCGSR